MKILTSPQLKELDKYTIVHEPIPSIDLMERAAHALTEAIERRWDKSYQIIAFAGPGNNGGDALAVARMLSKKGYHVEVFLFNTQGKLSEECQANLNRLKTCGSIYFTEISTQFDPPTLTDKHLVIDGLFGSGLNKPLNGGFASVVKYINASKAQVVAIDIPSGLMGEDNTYNVRQNIIHADVAVLLAVEDQHRHRVGMKHDIVLQFLIEAVGHIKGARRRQSDAIHSPEGLPGHADHGKQRLMHPHGRCLHHKLYFSRHLQQIRQRHQGHIRAEAGCENAQILHLGEFRLCVGRHRQKGGHTVFQRKSLAVHGTFAVGGKIEAERSRPEQRHFLRDPLLNGIRGAAAEAVNAQHHPADITAIRARKDTGYVQFLLRKQKSILHTITRFVKFPS